jgi:hypothetical protein
MYGHLKMCHTWLERGSTGLQFHSLIQHIQEHISRA